MKTILCLTVTFLTVLYFVNCESFVVGNVFDRVQLGKHELVKYNSIPFLKRVKNYAVSFPEHKKIQGIQAMDTMNSKASIIVTEGGVGHSFVNLKLKSERGRGLSYDIIIYVDPDFVYLE